MNKYITPFHLQNSWNIVSFFFQKVIKLDSTDFAMPHGFDDFYYFDFSSVIVLVTYRPYRFQTHLFKISLI